MLLHTVLVCLALGLAGQIAAVPLTELRYAAMAPFKNQWAITVDSGREGQLVNRKCPSPQPASCPGRTPLKVGEGDVVLVKYAFNGTLPFKTRPNAGAPTEVEVKMCYSALSATDRGWRKKNRAYPRLDQACSILIKKAPFNAAGGEAELVIDEEDELPTATWWFMVRVFCEDGKVCQWDSTETAVNLTTAVATITPNSNYIETHAELGITPGLVAATIIMSLFGPCFLIVYWVADHMYFTKTGKPLSFVGY